MRFWVGGIVSGLLASSQLLHAQTTQPGPDAAALYEAADRIFRQTLETKNQLCCPSNSNLEFPGFPLFSSDWLKMEKQDFAANAKAREIVSQAREVQTANWPAYVEPKPDLAYLNHCRELANDLADAAMYQHLQGDNPAALETVKDLLHMADLLQNGPEKRAVRFLVSIGIQGSAMDRLNGIVADSDFTDAPNNSNAIRLDTGADLLKQLLRHGEARADVGLYLKKPDAFVGGKADVERFVLTCARCYTERDMAAMSIACHLYRAETDHWPVSVADLKKYLPTLPIDPLGDGKQTLGYVLVKRGSSDRPLVYSHDHLQDDLFCRTDRPFYSRYSGDGSNLPWKDQKQGGQFRDVASWMPFPMGGPVATIQTIETEKQDGF
jgi:hypothetical protein